MSKLSQNLKKIRKEHNLSQEQLADQLGVSRQSVSKWESEQSYPEMDKLVQLSKLYNLNFDDLINNDIEETNKKENLMSKYIDSFINFIKNTINMFISMDLKSKLKCILEQIFIVLLLVIFFSTLNIIGNKVFYNILYPITHDIYYFISNIFKSIYSLATTILSIFIIIYIFKLRYLNYYILSKKDEKVVNNKLKFENKEEKIIIRDPSYSEYNFLNKLIHCILILIKVPLIFISICFCISLIFLGIMFVLSFLIYKTKLLFLGLLICLSACILINLDILLLIYNFIFNRKSNIKVIIYTFIISLLFVGLGSGMIMFEFSNFDYLTIDELSSNLLKEEEFNVEMSDSLILHDSLNYYDIVYKEENRNDLKIKAKHSDFISMDYEKDGNIVFFSSELKEQNVFKIFRNIVKYINEEKIVDYSKVNITVYTSKENIEKLKQNNINFYKNSRNHYDID